MTKKYLIFDAGPLIAFTMNGLLPTLENLKKEFQGEFIITPAVKNEVVDYPIKTKKYELEGLKVKDLIDRGILKMSSEFVPNNKLQEKTQEILKLGSTLFVTPLEKIRLMQEGEASSLAFAKLCNCENLIVIDERTTRLIVEAPENLKEIMESKLHTKIDFNRKNLDFFKDFRFIRSAELVYIAYKKDLFNLKKDKQLLDALLYSLKFKGTAISSKEIEEIKSLV